MNKQLKTWMQFCNVRPVQGQSFKFLSDEAFLNGEEQEEIRTWLTRIENTNATREQRKAGCERLVKTLLELAPPVELVKVEAFLDEIRAGNNLDR